MWSENPLPSTSRRRGSNWEADVAVEAMWGSYLPPQHQEARLWWRKKCPEGQGVYLPPGEEHKPEPVRSVPASHPREWYPPVWLLRESLPSKSWMAILLKCIRWEPWKPAWQSTSLAHTLDMSNYWAWTAFFMAMGQLPLVTMPGIHIAISPLQNIHLSFFLPILPFLPIKLYGS